MAFEGFAKEADTFFRQLAVKQDRDWFKTQKAEYERLWVEPMKALLAELRPGLERAFKGLRLAPDKHFRIYRDVRFSKDKSPFKTYQAAMIQVDDGKGGGVEGGGPAAIYLHLGTEDFAGAGHWMFEPPQLAKYRATLIDNKAGASIAKQAEALKKKGFGISAFEALKKPPKGVDPSHPRAWLLKLKGLGIDLPKIPASVRHSPKLAGWLVDQVKAAAPLVVEVEKKRRTWK